MIFVTMATMMKQVGTTVTVRGSSQVVLNAKSEAEAVGRFIGSPDVTEYMQNGWSMGQVSALEIKPCAVFQDADFVNVLKEAHKQAAEETLTKEGGEG